MLTQHLIGLREAQSDGRFIIHRNDPAYDTNVLLLLIKAQYVMKSLYLHTHTHTHTSHTHVTSRYALRHTHV